MFNKDSAYCSDVVKRINEKAVRMRFWQPVGTVMNKEDVRAVYTSQQVLAMAGRMSQEEKRYFNRLEILK